MTRSRVDDETLENGRMDRAGNTVYMCARQTLHDQERGRQQGDRAAIGGDQVDGYDMRDAQNEVSVVR